MTRYKVIVSDRAKAMLGTHIKFLAQVSLPAARNTKAALLEAMRSLSEMPERFPFLDEDFVPRGKYHKMLTANRYLILYQIKDQAVYVDYVVDCRQDYEWLLH
jgi:plasmid stabilization system protein ParE